MTTVFRRERVTRRVEHVVPADPPYGACWNEVALAIRHATQELRANGRLRRDEEPADDLIRILPGDSEIVVFYETDATATPWDAEKGVDR